MEKQAAMQLIAALARGIDPHTGETFPAHSPYQHPDTVRALFQALEALADPTVRSRSGPQSLPENTGKPWTDAEDKALMAGFDGAKTLTELADHHRRTRAAIQARLVRLGKIDPAAAAMPRYRIAMPAAQAA